jgi:hypothetical protein
LGFSWKHFNIKAVNYQNPKEKQAHLHFHCREKESDEEAIANSLHCDSSRGGGRQFELKIE